MADWMLVALVALVAFIELAISLPFELLLSLVVAYLLAAFGRFLCFTSTRCCSHSPPPLLYTAFRFLFGRFQHLPAPLWCPLKRIPSEQLLLLLLLAACCLLSVFFFLLARKMIPTYNCFCCTPHARTVARPLSLYAHQSLLFSRSSRAPNPSYVEIIRQDLCE